MAIEDGPVSRKGGDKKISPKTWRKITYAKILRASIQFVMVPTGLEPATPTLSR